jgi:hypothetical protein
VSPLPLPPQHCTVPPESSAHAEKEPAEMAIAPVNPLTAVGVLRHPDGSRQFVPPIVPSPTSPSPLAPQHRTVPPESSTQAELLPTETAVTVNSAVASPVPELPPEEEPEPGPLPDDAAPPSAGLLLEPEFPQARMSETPTMLVALRFMAPPR